MVNIVSHMLQTGPLLSHAYYMSRLSLGLNLSLGDITMRIKNLVLTSTLVLSIIGSSLASAAATETTATKTIPMTKLSQTDSKAHHTTWNSKHGHQGAGKLLTVQQQADLHTIKQAMFIEMRPLLKEKHALRLQLMGKIATPAMPWSDVEVVLNKINVNHAKMTTLVAKTQLTTFQKLGVTLPLHHKQRAYSHNEHRGHSNPRNHHQYC